KVGGCPSTSAKVAATPHPFNSETTVSINNGEKILSVKIYDLHGSEIVRTGSLDQNEVSIGSDLKAGIYIMHVVTENGNYTQRIIKTE
ncbi:MAG: T9SS type A sorting domain-containing protein, partial [Cytophagaceae bacterium]|nr:T9SS type A sorting domain-containing protein [Cytophagaceae bacterium]